MLTRFNRLPNGAVRSDEAAFSAVGMRCPIHNLRASSVAVTGHGYRTYATPRCSLCYKELAK